MSYYWNMDVSDYNNRLKNTGRNDQCPCGSGKKYKMCHLEADEAAKHEELAKAAEEREAAAAAEAAADDGDAGTSGGSRSGKPHRDGHQHSGKSRGGLNRKVNIPRRGAV